MPDLYEQMDRVEKAELNAKGIARIMGAFNLQLVDMGVHDVTANELTKIYANRVLAGRPTVKKPQDAVQK